MQPSYEIFNTNGLPESLHEKVGDIIKVLNQPVININQLRSLCKDGIPDQAFKIREYCWKILLGYLPEQRSKWDSTIKAKQQSYQEFIKAFLPQQKYKDYPLIIDKHSQRWKELAEDYLLWQQIEKDTSRTHASLNFFAKPTKEIMIPFLTGPRRQKFRLMVGLEIQKYQQFLKNKEMQRVTYKYHIMTRILFIYSKANPKIKYVQGMNEVLAPIFYLINSQKNNQYIEESSCFFMLNNAMNTILQLHIKDLDHSEAGVDGKLDVINKMLIVIEPKVWDRLQSLEIYPFFYSFRWMALLFSQEFQLFDVMRLWDSIFSYADRLSFMNYIAISIIMSKKQIILKHGFTQILQKLQNLKFDIDIIQIIELAHQLFIDYKQVDFEQTSEYNKKIIMNQKKKKQQKKMHTKHINQ